MCPAPRTRVACIGARQAAGQGNHDHRRRDLLPVTEHAWRFRGRLAGRRARHGARAYGGRDAGRPVRQRAPADRRPDRADVHRLKRHPRDPAPAAAERYGAARLPAGEHPPGPQRHEDRPRALGLPDSPGRTGSGRVTDAPALKIGVLAWNQYTDWPGLRDVGVLVDELGFDSLWTWDHLYPIVGDPHGPMFEGYMTLAAWAALTKRVSLGLMVGANTFRNPALVAKMVTTLDHISGGRAYLGIGGAWFETEHTAFGIPFGKSPGERLNWFDEAVELMRGMLHDEEPTARGSFYQARDVRNNPPPLQERLPILIGGSGERKTLHTVAAYADAWNTGGDVERVRHKDEVLRRWCDEVGRDHTEIERTLVGSVPIIRDTEAEALKVAEAMTARNKGWRGPQDGPFGPAELVAEKWAPFLDLGFEHIYIDCPAPFDHETIERLATEVKPILERR